MGLIKSQNILVGVSNKYIYNSSNFAGTTGAATILNTDTGFLLTPTTDATKMTPGDIFSLGTVTNLVVSSIDATTGTVFASTAVGVTLAGGAVASQLWRNLGASDGGVDITGQVTKTPQYVDDVIWSVMSVLTKGEVGVVMPLAEILMNNLALAFGDTVASVSIVAGVSTYKVNPTAVREDAYLITGTAPGTGALRTVYMPRGINQGSVSLKMDKSNKQILALKIDGQYDTTRNYPIKFVDGPSWVYTGH